MISHTSKFIAIFLLLSSSLCFGKTFYVSVSDPNAKNIDCSARVTCNTTSSVPLKADKFNLTALQWLEPGDELRLKKGDVWSNATIIIELWSGTPGLPIIISSYGEGANPKLKSHQSDVNSALIFKNSAQSTRLDLQGYIVDGIDFYDSEKIGVNLTFPGKVGGNITIKNSNFINVKSGIALGESSGISSDHHLKDIKIYDNLFHKCSEGGVRSFTKAVTQPGQLLVSGLVIERNQFSHCGDFSIHVHRGGDIVIRDNIIMNSGNDFADGSAGIYLGDSSDIWIFRNKIHQSRKFASNPDGVAIDLEVGNSCTKIENNVINNGFGAAIFLYNNGLGETKGNVKTNIINNVFYNNSQVVSSGSHEKHAEILSYGSQSGQISKNYFYLRGYLTATSEKTISTVAIAPVQMSEVNSRLSPLYFDVFDVTFEPNFYADLHADLYSRFNYRVDLLSQHWFRSGINEGRVASPAFDVLYYLNLYPDLKQAMGLNYTKLREHFVAKGIAEGRVASEVFDVVFYKKLHPDISQMSNLDALKHFLTMGIVEGRQGSKNFSVRSYVNRYPDLQQTFGRDYRQAITHYYRRGKIEGRSGMQDPVLESEIGFAATQPAFGCKY